MEFATTALRFLPGLMTPGSLAAPGVFCLVGRKVFSGAPRRAADWSSIAYCIDCDLWRHWHACPLRPPGCRANLSGCFLLGLIGQFTMNRLVISPDWRVAIAVGFFGGYTTFSSFGWETAKLLEEGAWLRASAYVGASVVAGLLLSVAGIRLANKF